MLDVIYIDWTLLLLSTIGFLYGWYVGRKHGVNLGAEEMFDQMYDNGTDVPGKRYTRTIEISLEDNN